MVTLAIGAGAFWLGWLGGSFIAWRKSVTLREELEELRELVELLTGFNRRLASVARGVAGRRGA